VKSFLFPNWSSSLIASSSYEQQNTTDSTVSRSAFRMPFAASAHRTRETKNELKKKYTGNKMREKIIQC
jgi:hypothetical protein